MTANVVKSVSGRSSGRSGSTAASAVTETDLKRAYSSFPAGGDDHDHEDDGDENNAGRCESYQLSSSSSSSISSFNESWCDNSHVTDAPAAAADKQLKDRSKCMDMRGGDVEKKRLKSQKSDDNNQRTLLLLSECSRSNNRISVRHESSETMPVTSDQGCEAMSVSPVQSSCSASGDSPHSEGNIDLVHVRKGQHKRQNKDKSDASDAAAASASATATICNNSVNTTDISNHCNRYDAASISTITSADFSHREEADDMSISEDDGCDGGERAGGESCSDAENEDQEQRIRRCRRSGSRAASVTGWNERTRKFAKWRSESSTSDNVFHDSPSSPRKFISRGYQAYCDRRERQMTSSRENSCSDNNGWSSERRDRSFSRSSGTSFRRNHSHISRRLYDFDEYTTPDRDERINRTLYLGGLTPDVTDSEIRQLFEKFGDIRSVFIKRVDNSRNTTYGFVKMGNLMQAFHARAELNDYRFNGMNLVVRYGKTYPTSRVWLGNLSPETDSNLLYQELDRFGAVVKLVHFRASGEALADFESIPGATEAKNGMRGVVLDANGIRRSSPSPSLSSSTSSSRPPSASTPSPPPHSSSSSSVPFPAHHKAETAAAVTTAVEAISSPKSASSHPKLRGIITDFDDHESNDLLDRAAFFANKRVQSTYFEDSAPPDSSFTGINSQPFSSCTLSA
jgi:hypothetical protein